MLEFLLSIFREFYGNEIEFSTTEEVCDVVYLDDNGVTIKAYPCANIVWCSYGIYTVVDRDILDLMIENKGFNPKWDVRWSWYGYFLMDDVYVYI